MRHGLPVPSLRASRADDGVSVWSGLRNAGCSDEEGRGSPVPSQGLQERTTACRYRGDSEGQAARTAKGAPRVSSELAQSGRRHVGWRGLGGQAARTAKRGLKVSSEWLQERTTACRFGGDLGGRLLGDLGVPESTNLGRRRVGSGFRPRGSRWTTACRFGVDLGGWLLGDLGVTESTNLGRRRVAAEVSSKWARSGRRRVGLEGTRNAGCLDGEGWAGVSSKLAHVDDGVSAWWVRRGVGVRAAWSPDSARTGSKIHPGWIWGRLNGDLPGDGHDSAENKSLLLAPQEVVIGHVGAETKSTARREKGENG